MILNSQYIQFTFFYEHERADFCMLEKWIKFPFMIKNHILSTLSLYLNNIITMSVQPCGKYGGMVERKCKKNGYQ